MLNKDYHLENDKDAYILCSLYDKFIENITAYLNEYILALADVYAIDGYYTEFYEIYLKDNIITASFKVIDNQDGMPIKYIHIPLSIYWTDRETLSKLIDNAYENNKQKRELQNIIEIEKKEKAERELYLRLKLKYEKEQ